MLQRETVYQRRSYMMWKRPPSKLNGGIGQSRNDGFDRGVWCLRRPVRGAASSAGPSTLGFQGVTHGQPIIAFSLFSFSLSLNDDRFLFSPRLPGTVFANIIDTFKLMKTRCSFGRQSSRRGCGNTLIVVLGLGCILVWSRHEGYSVLDMVKSPGDQNTARERSRS